MGDGACTHAASRHEIGHKTLHGLLIFIIGVFRGVTPDYFDRQPFHVVVKPECGVEQPQTKCAVNLI